MTHEKAGTEVKHVLITGENSYIGTSVEKWLKQWPSAYSVDTIDMLDDTWQTVSFSKYDVIFHVAGIAHVSADPKKRDLYFKVNRDLAIATATKAKQDGAKQFIFMSSMIVYGTDERLNRAKIIKKETKPAPSDFYGESKLEADKGILAMATETFRVVVLRPPVLYGPGCKGNFPKLIKMAKNACWFPDIDNARSMIYIDNFCEFVRSVIDRNASGVFFPQNASYISTKDVIATYRRLLGKNTYFFKVPKVFLNMLSHIALFNKVFATRVYDQKMSGGTAYQLVGFEDSIKSMADPPKKRLMVISQYFYPEQFRVNDICKEWIKRGYEVTVVTGIPNYPQGKFYKGYGLFHGRKETYAGIKIIRLPIVPRGNGSLRLVLNYFSFVVSGFFFSKFTRRKADFVYIHEVSPMTQALVGVWFAKRREIPCILYVTDLWPENVQVVGGIKNEWLLHLIGKMVDHIYANCTKILTASQSFIQAIQSRDVPCDMLTYWPHYAEDFYFPRDRTGITLTNIPQDDSFNIVFAGNIGKAQGLEILPQAAAFLKHHGIKVRFIIIGDGRAKRELMEAVQTEDAEAYFHFVDRQPAEQIPEYIALCDAALISLTRNPIFAMTIPTKLQSYLACGIPIIASGEGELYDIVHGAELGLCSPPGDAKSLAANIIRMVSMPAAQRDKIRENEIIYYEEHFDKRKLLDEMDVLLKELSGGMKNV